MLIKTINGAQKSEWMKHSRKNHLELLKHPPEKIEIYIRDFYPNSPDNNETVVISFTIFNALARQFVLENEAQHKCDERNLSTDEITDAADPLNLDLLLETKANNQTVKIAINHLGITQKRRIALYFNEGLTLNQIANLEQVNYNAVRKSIQAALKKIKNEVS